MSNGLTPDKLHQVITGKERTERTGGSGESTAAAVQSDTADRMREIGDLSRFFTGRSEDGIRTILLAPAFPNDNIPQETNDLEIAKVALLSLVRSNDTEIVVDTGELESVSLAQLGVLTLLGLTTKEARKEFRIETRSPHIADKFASTQLANLLPVFLSGQRITNAYRFNREGTKK